MEIGTPHNSGSGGWASLLEFVNAGALQRLLCARWLGILR